MKKAGFIFSIILISILYAGQLKSQSTFQRVIGGTAGDELANYAELTSDSGQIMVGYTDGFGSGSNDVYLVKTDANGDIEWNKTYGGVGNDIGYAVEATSDGGYIVVGETSSSGAGGQDIFLVKTDAMGDTLWTKTYGGSGIDIGYSVRGTFDGGYILAGYTGSFGSGAEDVYVIKTDAMGDTLWTKTYGSGGFDYAYSIAQTADTGYILTGETYIVGGGDAFLIKTDSMGDTTWTKTYGGAAGFEAGWAVKETMDGGYVFAGWTSSFGSGGFDVYMVKTDAVGDTLWTRAYGGALDDIGLSIVESADTMYLVGGYTYSFGTINGDAYGLGVDSMGTVLWSMAYGGVSGDAAYSIDKTSDGGYAISGYSYSLSGGVGDFYLLHTDSSGSTGSCYETSTATATSMSASNVGSLNVASVMNSIVGTNGTTVTNPAGVSRAEFVATASSANLLCNGDSSGTATAIPTGGTVPYTYVWDDPMAQANVTADSLSIGTYKVVVTDAIGCVDSASVTITEPTVLTASITDSSDVACNGDSTGSATVTPAGGTSPYFYLWDDVNTQTDSLGNGLPAGNFSVVVSDNNSCQVTVNTTISESTVLALSTSTTQAGCGLTNGTANVSASGATPPYTYSWNTSPVQTDSAATGLAFGLYTITVNDSLGCIDSASVNITNTGGPSVSITDSVDVLCNGDSTGSATVTPVGGTLPYVYLWNDSSAQTDSTAVGLPIGVYTVNVTDSGGCGATAVVAITEPATALSLSITNDTLSCFGNSSGTATVVATGGTTGYIYAWDDPLTQSTAIATSLSAGAIQVIVTDGNGCTDSASAVLTEPAAIVLIISDSNHIACNGDGDGSATVSASGGVGPLSYLWDDPSTQTNSVMTGVDGGTYTCIVTDSTGCSMSVSFTINEPTAISLSASSSVTVACNTDSSATMTATASGGFGTLNYLWDDPSAQTTTTATSVPNGSYTVVVTDSAGCSITDSLSFGILVSISTSVPPICGGICDGTASVAVMGNAGTVTYSWDNPGSSTTATVSSLCSGNTFTGTVTDTLGCSTSTSVTFPSLTPLTVTLTITSVKCFGDLNGAATAFVSGGGTPYTYSWPSLGSSDAFVNTLAAGNYDVILTDGNGCTVVSTATVPQPAAPLSTTTFPAVASCTGGLGISSVSVSGGTAPYQYQWDDPGVFPSSTIVAKAGTYIVTVTDTNNCTIVDTTTITDPAPLLVSGASSLDGGDSSGQAWVIVSGGTGSYTYLWDDTEEQTTDSAFNLPFGIYTVVVTDGKGCSSSLDIAVADASVAIFETSYEGSFDDLVRDMDLLTGGGHIMAGITESFGAGGSDMLLLNSDNNSILNWAKTYGGSADDGANSVLQSSDGGYILAGYTSSFGSGNTDVYVVKTDVDGVIEWSQTYGGPLDEKAYSIVERTGGYVIAGGTNSFGAGQTDVYVIDIDDLGVVQWTATYGGSDYDYGYDIKTTTDGGYIVAGYTNSFGAGAADAYLIKLNASGSSMWTKVMGGDKDDAAWSVIETPTGYAFTGNTESFGSGQQDVYFVITDATGTPTLTTALGGSQLDFGNDLTSTSDGGFAIAGYTRSFSNFGDDVYLIKTDGSGVVTWSRSFGGAFADRAWAIQETSTGELVIAGNSQSTAFSLGAGKWAYYLIKTDSSGNSECNLGSPNTIENDTLGAPITIGGLEGTGGSASASSTAESLASTLSEIICYTSTDIQHLSTESFELGIYPNPNNGQFTLVMNLVPGDASLLIRIFNVNGELLKSEEIAGNGEASVTIDLGDVPAGMYYVQVISDSISATRKVIIH